VPLVRHARLVDREHRFPYSGRMDDWVPVISYRKSDGDDRRDASLTV
jgi:hypothetical protein